MTLEERTRLDEELRYWRDCDHRAEQVTVQKMPHIVHIPFKRADGEYTTVGVPRCCRMMSDGRRCDSLAIEGEQECLRHYRWYHVYPMPSGLPYPDDALSVQEIVGKTIAMVMSGKLKVEQAEAVAKLCRVLANNLGRCGRQLDELWWRR